MSDTGDSGFQSRLARIQQKNADAVAHEAEEVQSPTQRRGVFWRVMVVCLLAVTVIGGGAYATRVLATSTEIPLRQMAENLLTRAVASVPSSTSYDGLVSSGPKELRLRDTGWEYPETHVVFHNRQDILLSDITQPAPEISAQDVPKVVAFAGNLSCTLQRPSDDNVVHSVRFMGPGRYTHMHLFSKEELANAVGERIKGITKGKYNYRNGAIADGRMALVDVFVTDTSAPVYLVLGVMDADVFWNIHLAEGVTLSHVAMIGNKSGFAAPDGNHTYEALRIRDFLKGDAMYENEQPQDCMVAPWRSPKDWWPVAQKLTDPVDARHYKTVWDTNSNGFAAYNAWFQAQTGRTAGSNATEALTASNVIVGPLPATPIARTPVTQRTMHVAANDYLALNEDQINAMHDNLILAATGGDLSVLTPSPIKLFSE